MKIEIICKDYHLDSNLKSIIEKKLSKFDRYFDGKAKAKVKLSTFKNNNYIMEVTISEDDLIVRAKTEADKMNKNIDLVLPKLEKQILKYKNKFKSKNKKSFDEPAIYENEIKDIPPSERIDKVVKVKKFNISITSIENAIEEMDLLDHNFFVFVNGDSNKVNVLYRRNDGTLGLIEPEY
ncbi:MAG: ribosome-associated translation inhibitor RaiA [Clostridia bacterium]|nr:ribosome-associated translation inhibitor RaiA [Clostridia bacterium]